MLKFKRELEKAVSDAAESLGISKDLLDFDVLEDPSDPKYGDYSCMLAMRLAKKVGKNPQELAQELAKKIKLPSAFEKLEVLAPAFINFFLSPDALLKGLSEPVALESKYKNSKILLEHSSPNLFKPFHIGHMVNNSYGEALRGLLTLSGAAVKTISFPSDISLGIAKAVWGIKKLSLQESFDIEDLGKAYALGVEAYEKDEVAKKQMHEINEKLYKEIPSEDLDIYLKGKELSMRFFKDTLKLFDSQIDEFIFESEAEKVGKEIVRENCPKIFEKSQGAYIFRGSEKCSLHDDVFINSQGFGTYLAKDLGLLKIKFNSFDFDFSFTITDSEQREHFKLVKCAAFYLNGPWSEKSHFLHHGRMSPKEGKFSSRYGNVPLAEDVLSHVRKKVEELMRENKIIVEAENSKAIALATLKYVILKVSMGKKIIWDEKSALSFEGDSGPYILYSYVRAQSLLKKSQFKDSGELPHALSSEKELSFARLLLKFDESLQVAADNLAPHKLLNYAMELASEFNRFYAEEKFIGSESENVKIFLTKAFTKRLKLALEALAIPLVDKM